MPELYEVVLEQSDSVGAVRTINRWNYRLDGIPAAVTGAFALASAFGGVADSNAELTSVMLGVHACQSNNVVFNRLLVNNIYDLDEFYEVPYTAGSVTGNSPDGNDAPFVAIGFRSNRVSRNVRRAYKRIWGVPDEFVLPGGFLDNTFVTNAVEPLANFMGQNLEYDDEGNTLTFTPVVIKRVDYTAPSGRKAYKYPEDPAQGIANAYPVNIWTHYPTVRTQNSRQYGRGM